MARTTKEESLKTRQRIIDTAIDLFYQQGVSATSLENIAEAAKMTRGAIYWHFKNKPAVVSAIHDQFHISIIEEMYPQLKNTSLSPISRIKNASIQFLKRIATDEIHKKIMTIFRFKCDYSGEMAALLEEQVRSKQASMQYLTACFQEALDTKEISDKWQAAYLTHSHICYMTGIINEYLQNNTADRLKRDAEQLVAFYFEKL